MVGGVGGRAEGMGVGMWWWGVRGVFLGGGGGNAGWRGRNRTAKAPCGQAGGGGRGAWVGNGWDAGLARLFIVAESEGLGRW